VDYTTWAALAIVWVCVWTGYALRKQKPVSLLAFMGIFSLAFLFWAEVTK